MWLIGAKKPKGVATFQGCHAQLSKSGRFSFKWAWLLCFAVKPLAFLAQSSHLSGLQLIYNTYFRIPITCGRNLMYTRPKYLPGPWYMSTSVVSRNQELILSEYLEENSSIILEIQIFQCDTGNWRVDEKKGKKPLLRPLDARGQQ